MGIEQINSVTTNLVLTTDTCESLDTQDLSLTVDTVLLWICQQELIREKKHCTNFMPKKRWHNTFETHSKEGEVLQG